MEIDVASVIEEVLASGKAVSIKGLGKLQYVDSPARIIEDNSQILPPKTTLQLGTAATNNKSLRKSLMSKYGLDKDQALKAIKKFTESVVNTVLNYDEVVIKDVVHIRSEEGKIKLTPLGAFADSSNLPIVSLQPLNRQEDKALSAIPKVAATAATIGVITSRTKAAPADKIPSTPVTKANRQPTPPPPIVTKSTTQPQPATSAPELTSLKPNRALQASKVPAIPPKAAVKEQSLHSKTEKSVISSSNPKPMSLNDKFAKTGTSSTTGKPSSTAPKYSVTDSFKESIQNTPTKPATPYVSPPPEKEGCFGPIMALVALLLLLALCYKGCNYAVEKYNNSKGTKMAATADITDTDGSDEDVIDSATQSGSSSSDDETGYDLPESCIIITGVFSRSSNASRMRLLLDDRGYDVYQEEYGPYTRVGLEFDCKDEDLEEYLQNIRKSVPYASKAWYLQPELYVNY